MLLPPTCPGCGRSGPALCGPCAATLRPPPSLPAPPGLDALHVLVGYEGVGRELAARLKYRNQRALLRSVGRAVAALVTEPVDVVTWAPTTTARRRARGFDQAELLARVVARSLGVPARRLLARVPGPPQTGRSAAARRAGPAFRVRAAAAGRLVLVVDDVVTTGATLTAAARALRTGGVRGVVGAAIARPPLKAGEPETDTLRDVPAR